MVVAQCNVGCNILQSHDPNRTLVVSPLDMMGLIGMAQVLAALAYGVQGLRRGFATCVWPSFNPNPARENNKLKDGPSMRPRHGFTPL